MTKRTTIMLAVGIALFLFLISSGPLSGWLFSGSSLKHVNAKAAILIDANTGQTLFTQHADTPMPPASMSKMMTELIVLEAVENGEAAWDDSVVVRTYAASVPGAGAGLQAGSKHTVRELFDSMAVHSANDAAVALAEHLAGSEKQFVDRMNSRARSIGLSDETVFANATGLSSIDLASFEGAAADGDTEMTARDTATLARYLISAFPEVLTVTSRPEVDAAGTAEGTAEGAVLRTTNMMLPGERFAYPGSDGLKTGYTERAGYCFTGTTSRDGKRLIAVVMGTDTADERFVETERLYDLGFGEKQGTGGSLTAGLSRLAASAGIK